jgi:hypothetical protein
LGETARKVHRMRERLGYLRLIDDPYPQNLEGMRNMSLARKSSCNVKLQAASPTPSPPRIAQSIQHCPKRLLVMADSGPQAGVRRFYKVSWSQDASHE